MNDIKKRLVSATFLLAEIGFLSAVYSLPISNEVVIEARGRQMNVIMLTDYRLCAIAVQTKPLRGDWIAGERNLIT